MLSVHVLFCFSYSEQYFPRTLAQRLLFGLCQPVSGENPKLSYVLRVVPTSFGRFQCSLSVKDKCVAPNVAPMRLPFYNSWFKMYNEESKVDATIWIDEISLESLMFNISALIVKSYSKAQGKQTQFYGFEQATAFQLCSSFVFFCYIPATLKT